VGQAWNLGGKARVQMWMFVKQLAVLCREQITRTKWMLVASHAIDHTVGERIALNGMVNRRRRV
jgi:hypothetical protein